MITVQSLHAGCLESKIDTLHTESSGEPGSQPKEEIPSHGVPLYPIQESVRLLDANQIFQPLLSGLGVMQQQLRFTTMSDSSKVRKLKIINNIFMLFQMPVTKLLR